MMIRKMYKAIVCADGFSMSVQANETSYCSPRENGADKYEEVEVGFPNTPEPMLHQYAEDPESPTETVYAWVPSQVVTNVIAKHGGIVSGELPPGIPFLSA
jgi:hypothetical protein